MNPKLFDVEVAQVRQLTPRVREYLLTSLDGAPLPMWSAGAHIALHIESPDRRLVLRHYSLIGGDGATDDPPNTYRIAVQRASPGLGSRLMHDTCEAGTRLRIGPPVNSFALDRNAIKVLLLAGGIGVTPLVPMARSLLLRKRPLQFIYAGRSIDEMAYAQTLQAMCGSSIRLHCGDTNGRLDIPALLAQQDSDTQAYVCGPASFIEAAARAGKNLGWDEGRLRSEVFVSATMPGDQAFKVTLQRMGTEIDVRNDESVLDALNNARIPVFWDCRRGECGLCATRVIRHDGEFEHRDRYLTPEEKEAGHAMCLCVSRIKGTRLVLDL